MVKSSFNHRIKQLVWRRLYPNLAGIGRLGSKVRGEPKSPVFVVGTGRCGTDLLTGVLGSHPQVVAFPDEANELWHPNLYPFEEATIEYPPIEVDPQGFTELSVQSWPPRHAERISYTFAGFCFIFSRDNLLIVKSAMISFMIPKLLEIYPDAKFIHIYRSGPSVVESYMKKNFGTYARYTFREDEYRMYCAKYWNSCILEIERVKTSLSLPQRNAYFELSYEGFCARIEYWLSCLARYLGIKEAAFGFDTSSIRNQNYKIGDYTTDPKWAEPLRVMEQAMRLKGYVPEVRLGSNP